MTLSTFKIGSNQNKRIFKTCYSLFQRVNLFCLSTKRHLKITLQRLKKEIYQSERVSIRLINKDSKELEFI